MKNKNKKFQISFITAISVALAFSFSTTNVSASQISTDNVSYLINKERTYYGLEPLRINNELNIAATNKADDMINRDYFEHYAYGLTPWDFINFSGYNYLYAGENLAMDFQTSEGMVNAWMNSDIHRENILNPDYDEIGIGVVKGVYTENGQDRETVIVTNMFGRKRPVVLDVFNNIVDKIVNLFTF
jgi:uncharacterized protein YkwD